MAALILTYHSIDDSGSVISTAPEVFRRQMRQIHESSFAVISLAELVEATRECRPLPQRSLIITFDDGYRNVYSAALPVLRQYGFTATVFLVTDYCGRNNDWPGQGREIRPMPLLSWAEAAEMRQAGLEFGSHTATHPDLTRVSDEQAAEELKRSKTAIELHLGAEPVTIAYPYGKYDARVKALAQREFQGAVTTELGQVGDSCDLHLLRRVDMYYFTGPTIFKALLEDRADWYLSARQALRKVKAFVR